MLDPPLARLESRARLRLAKNAEKMAAEVRLTLQRQLSKEGDRANELPLVKACGFREFAACFADNLGENEGRKSLAEARQETLLSVRRYIRRQLTWFRHQRPKPNILLKNGAKSGERPHRRNDTGRQDMTCSVAARLHNIEYGR